MPALTLVIVTLKMAWNFRRSDVQTSELTSKIEMKYEKKKEKMKYYVWVPQATTDYPSAALTMRRALRQK